MDMKRSRKKHGVYGPVTLVMSRNSSLRGGGTGHSLPMVVFRTARAGPPAAGGARCRRRHAARYHISIIRLQGPGFQRFALTVA
jgi:hypothetical protein